MTNKQPPQSESPMRELIRGGALSLGLKVTAALLAFLLNLILARTLSLNEMGLFFIALMVITFAHTFARFGQEGVLLREIARYGQSANSALAAGQLRQTLKIATIAGLSLTIATYIFAPYITQLLAEPALTTPLRIFSLAILPLALTILFSEALKGQKRVTESEVTLGITLPAVAILPLLAMGDTLHLQGVTWLYLSASIAAVTFGYWRLKCSGIMTVATTHRPSSLKPGFSLLLANCAALLIIWSPTLILGITESNSAVAQYNIAARIALLASFVLMAINTISAPRFAESYEKKNHQTTRNIAIESATLSTLSTLPIVIILILFAEPLLSLFGDDYAEASWLLIILAIGQFANALTGPVGQMLVMSGHNRQFRNCMLAGAVITLSLNLLLIPSYSAIGAAIATLLGIIFYNLLLLYQVHKKLRILVLPRLKLGSLFSHP